MVDGTFLGGERHVAVLVPVVGTQAQRIQFDHHIVHAFVELRWFHLVDHELLVGRGTPAVEPLHGVLVLLAGIADHVQVHHQFIPGEHPDFVLYLIILLLHPEALHEVEVGPLGDPGFDPVYRVGGIADPHLAIERELLRTFRLELQLVAPVLAHEGAIGEVVVVETLATIGDRAHEVLPEDHQEIVVDIDVLVHVAHELGHALVLDAAHLGAPDEFALLLRALAVVHLAEALRHEDGQVGLRIGAVDVVEDEGERLEELLLGELLGDVVQVELDLVVGIVLVGGELFAVVHRLVADHAAQDAERGVLLGGFDHHLGQFEAVGLKDDVDHLHLVLLHREAARDVSDGSHTDAIRRVVGIDQVIAVHIAAGPDAAIDEGDTGERDRLAGLAIGDLAGHFGGLRQRGVHQAQCE